MAVPVFVVRQVPVPRGTWKQNAGWSRRDVAVSSQVVDGALQILLDDGDGYSGAPLMIRLEPADEGRVSVLASGFVQSCVSGGKLSDLHGEVHLERRLAGSSDPLRLTFRIDALDEDCNLLRTEGAIEHAPTPGEWDVEAVSPAYVELDPPPDANALQEVWLRWTDGKPRAHGRVDATGRRHGEWETWSATGALQSSTEFQAGERHGWCHLFLRFWTTQGRMEHGLQQGEWIDTYRNADTVETFRTLYRDGRVVER